MKHSKIIFLFKLAIVTSIISFSGCGIAQPQGYFNMNFLALHVKENSWFGPPTHRHYPISVRCYKTGTFEAVCIPVYKEPKGTEAGTTFKEKISPNGKKVESIQ